MQTVSDAWKATHTERLLPETFIEITCDITEPGLQEKAVSAAADETDFSQSEAVADATSKDTRKYSTLEWNAWGLDGSTEYFEETLPDFGYVSEALSNSEGVYNLPPLLEISFEEVHTYPIAGVTITWAKAFNEWAEEFCVTVYNGTTQIAQETVTGNKDLKSLVWLEFESYDRITVEVLKWCLPYHRARTIQTRVGISTTYTKSDLLKFSNSQSVDLLSAALPKNELSFSLDNSDDKWNPDNPTGAEKYLLEQQKISLRYGMRVNDEIEWVNGGVYWLSEWDTPANGIEASFTARDVFSFGDVKYTGTKSGTLYEIAAAAMSQLSDVSYALDDVLESYSTSFEDEYTVAEVLQMVAHAGGCVLWQDRDGVVHIAPRDTTQSDYEITQDVSYSYPEYSISKPLKSVDVSYGGDQVLSLSCGSSGEVQTVDNPLSTSPAIARRIADAAKALLLNRKTITGECRADVRLDAGDVIKVHGKYAVNNVVVTDVTYSTSGGACRGRYTGRVV